ncbi:Helicase conserved C-terminal domain [Carpediemonas membranifera]|uniref:Helicase conserved C-terminal domain n=1 Tax=Carpediemonas membranifera TaxID=201153 RepID=A0A8J6B7F8_9EUKA|nr:Helicase conserved C-terminal domain [Carpediemonas membranifera]|eukprot:KAG9391587.1 Helicase conserved C-terminal domain [Carpediemonas membranifera]
MFRRRQQLQRRPKANNSAAFWEAHLQELEDEQEQFIRKNEPDIELKRSPPPMLSVLDITEEESIAAALKEERERLKKKKAAPKPKPVVDVSKTFDQILNLADIPDHTLGMDEVKRLNLSSEFTGRGDRYTPSEFQAHILNHINKVRKMVHHNVGLLVMATALGKTVVVALDIERQIRMLAEQYYHGSAGTAFDADDIEAILADDIGGLDGYEEEPEPVLFMGENGLEALPASSMPALPAPKPQPRSQKLFLDAMHNPDFQFTMLFLVHTTAIRDNALKTFQFHMKGLGLKEDGFFFQVKNKSGMSELCALFRENVIAHTSVRPRFIFTTFQTVHSFSQELATADGVAPKMPDVLAKRITHVVVDEVHHLLAHTFSGVYRFLKTAQNGYMLGMTATLRHRTDATGNQLKKLFNGIMYVDFPWTAAKELGHFPEVYYHEVMPMTGGGISVHTYRDLARTSRPQGRDTRRFIESLNFDMDRYRKDVTSEFIVDTYMDFIQFINNQIRSGESRQPPPHHDEPKHPVVDPDVTIDGDDDFIFTDDLTASTTSAVDRRVILYKPKKRAMIFVSTIAQADEVAHMLQRRGITGAKSAHSRQGRSALFFEQFAAGKLDVLVTVNMATEGYDVPGVDLVILARLTQSEVVFVQQLGRGLRKDAGVPDKQVDVLDVCFNLRMRWKQLSSELPPGDLAKQIDEFWPVNAFMVKK